MVENLTNITNLTNETTFTSSPILDPLRYIQTLAVAQVFGMAYTVILLFAFFGFKKVAEKKSFSLIVMFIGGIAYNSLVSYITIDPILAHFLNLFFVFCLGVIIFMVKRELT